MASSSSSSLIVSKTSSVINPKSYLAPPTHQQNFSFSKSLNLRFPRKTSSLNLKKIRGLSYSPPPRKSCILASSSDMFPIIKPSPIPKTTSNSSLLSDESTRAITSLFALAQLVSRIVAHKFVSEHAVFHGLREGMMYTAEGLLFAAISSRRPRGVNTPITILAQGMTKWLYIYNSVLMVRCFLSWYPTLPWEKQPFSAIRDLSDPYLNLFRGIIPPIMNTLDVSPLFAFAVLSALTSLLRQKVY